MRHEFVTRNNIPVVGRVRAGWSIIFPFSSTEIKLKSNTLPTDRLKMRRTILWLSYKTLLILMTLMTFFLNPRQIEYISWWVALNYLYDIPNRSSESNFTSICHVMSLWSCSQRFFITIWAVCARQTLRLTSGIQ